MRSCARNAISRCSHSRSAMRSGMQFSDRIGRRMKLHDIHVLMTVVQAGSMGKAAVALNTTQSAISRSIAELEDSIGVRLLDRSPQGVAPTQYGRALLRRGTAVFDELKQGVKDIEYLSDPGAGELCIGSGAPHSHGVVLAVLDRLSRQYPRATFQVIIAGTLDLHEHLRERRIELAFTRLTEDVPPEDIVQHTLFDDPYVVVVGVQNPFARRRKVKLADLVNEPWTWVAAGSVVDSIVVGAFRAAGVTPPRATIRIDDPSVRIKLATTGRFLAVIPASSQRLHDHPESIKVLPVELPTPYRRTGIIALKNRMLSPLAQLFIDTAREVAKPLAGK